MTSNRKNKKSLPLGRERVIEALETLKKYQAAKEGLERRIAENENWWCLSNNKAKGRELCGAWMFNSIAGKHADAMDSIPYAAVLPREESDRECADLLSKVLPTILERCGFEKVWSDCWYDKLKYGCGVYGVFWDSSKLGGVGDISIKRVDLSSLYFEDGICDIQDSENVFYVTYWSKEKLLGRWQQLASSHFYDGEDLKIRGAMPDEKSRYPVVDWYYKKRVGGKVLLHYCKFVGEYILYSSENDKNLNGRGYYEHGKYPFIFDSLYIMRGSPVGFGCIEIMKGAQEQIDLLEGAIMQNSRMAAFRRYFAKEASGINEEEFTSWNTPIVHYSGSGDPKESIMPIDVPNLGSVYLDMLEFKVNELKETSGNRDFSQGGTSYGVTAASAIEALQEAGSKLSRDMLKGSYRAFEELCLITIELIRQFYTLPRCFRITEGQKSGFVEFDNSLVRAVKQGAFADRLPIFDIEVKAQKQSPYSKAAINSLAESFFEKGFFSPEKKSEALICLEMMDFEGKERIRDLICGGENVGRSTLYSCEEAKND